jgi:ABC-type polysaccharide/polyol phosphate export permease
MFQVSNLQQALPSFSITAMSVLIALVTLPVGYTVFKRAEDDFVYCV